MHEWIFMFQEMNLPSTHQIGFWLLIPLMLLITDRDLDFVHEGILRFLLVEQIVLEFWLEGVLANLKPIAVSLTFLHVSGILIGGVQLSYAHLHAEEGQRFLCKLRQFDVRRDVEVSAIGKAK